MAPAVETRTDVDTPADAPFETVWAAIYTLRSSTDSHERIRAIGSLASSALEGKDVARIRSTLRVASADEDEDVAVRAQETYEQLVDRQDR